ncbi:hypothetical protein EIN_310020 [Entamoeba invadens IP1]|uniref:Uncharacterized protein n=1 Tax=Entamoeba invadens IP1 TaxID=370355 RepID=A0A0A1TWB7_ENTIV|nr:hypothetical protein EIN_310020 [Entamoeba invadens IP1]ELP84969.1 hypothetical protein EIN_310020 [Entamoeba invadens IP1]|eukprot:XP_004184315.1 hypothetical protein EIN_310020 [Entamoeba invadens IP1]
MKIFVLLFLIGFLVRAETSTRTQTLVQVNNKTIMTTNPDKIPLWKRLQKDVIAEQQKAQDVIDSMTATEKLKIAKTEEMDKLVNERLEKNTELLGEEAKLNVRTLHKFDTNETSQNKTKIEITHNSTSIPTTLPIDFDIPQSIRKDKTKPIIKKLFKHKKIIKRIVELDPLEEKMIKQKALSLIKKTSEFINNYDDDELL